MPITGSFIRNTYLEEVRVVLGLLRDKVLPCLGDINSRVSEIANERLREIGRGWTGDDPDVGGMAEVAYDDAIAIGQTMWGLQEGLKALAVATLFHLLEQQLRDLWRIAKRFAQEKRPRLFLDLLDDIGLGGCPQRNELQVLNLIANVAKHGDGGSAAALHKERPELFKHPVLPSGGMFAYETGGYFGSPILGEGLYLGDGELGHYGTLVQAFWEWVADEADKP